jgi:hypothetical protein
MMDVALDAEFALIPGFEGNPGFEIFHLEPVFDVDGQEKILVIFLGHGFAQILTG